MPKYIIEPGDNQASEESYLGRAKRVGRNTIYDVLQGIENVISPLEYLGINTPKPATKTAEYYGITPEERKPRGIVEQGLQRLAQGALPAAALGGVPALAALGVGTGAAELAGLAGAPEWVKDITQLGTEIGTGVAAHKFPEKVAKIPGIGKHLAKVKPISSTQMAKKEAYETAKEVGKTGRIKDKYGILNNALYKVEEALGTELRSNVSKKVTDALEKFQTNFSEGRLNPNAGLEMRKSLDALSKELSDKDAIKYIKPLRNALNDFFAIEAPEYYKHLDKADQLHQLHTMKTYVGDFLERYLKIPYVSILPLYKDVLRGFTNLFRGTERGIRGLISNDTARSHYFDTIRAITSNDPQIALKNLDQTISALTGKRKKNIKKVPKYIIE